MRPLDGTHPPGFVGRDLRPPRNRLRPPGGDARPLRLVGRGLVQVPRRVLGVLTIGRRVNRRVRWLVAVTVLVLVAFPAGFMLLIAVVVHDAGVKSAAVIGAFAGSAPSGGCAADPAHPAVADIPSGLGGDGAGADEDGVSPLPAYEDACERWGVDWAILAGIGTVECDHGRSRLPGCHPPGTTNPVGARGHMQFLGSTWRRELGQSELEPRTSPPAPDGQGYATDGDGDGDADPWSWPDATHSAARYLVDLGVVDDPEGALFGYNPSRSYVADVLALAASYRAAGADTGSGVPVELAGTAGNVPLTTVGGITVHTGIAAQVEGLVMAARAAGFELTGGGFRSPSEQIALRRQNCGSSDFAVFEMPSSQCSPPTARPGSSMHERGLAIDLSCDGALIRSRSSACFGWLAANAARFGLFNLPSEPWHWSVDGT